MKKRITPNLARMWSNWNFHTLLVGLGLGINTAKNCLAVCSTDEQRHNLRPSIPHIGGSPTEMFTKIKYMDLDSDTVSNSQKQEPLQLPLTIEGINELSFTYITESTIQPGE